MFLVGPLIFHLELLNLIQRQVESIRVNPFFCLVVSDNLIELNHYYRLATTFSRKIRRSKRAPLTTFEVNHRLSFPLQKVYLLKY